MNKRRTTSKILIALLAILALVAASCGEDEETSAPPPPAPAEPPPPAPEPPAPAPEPPPPPPAEEGISFGLALGGPRNDQAYFQSVYEGVVAYGGDPSIVDNLGDETAAGDAIRNLTEQHDLVVADITVFGSLLPIAEENPDTTYIITSGFFAQGDVPDNVYGYVTVYGWATYPMGVIAGTLSKSGKIGYITGPTFPIERTALAGYTQGAQSVNPDIEVVETVVSSYSDVPGTQQAATAQIASGVDVLYGFVDAGFVGLQQAADEAAGEVLLFSPVVDRCDRGDNIVGNNVSDIPAMVTAAIGDFANGTLPPRTAAYGLEDESIQFFNLCSGYQDAELVSLAEDTVAAIKDGSLQLPSEVTAR